MPEKTRTEKNVEAALKAIRRLKDAPTRGLAPAQVERIRKTLGNEVDDTCAVLLARADDKPPSFSLEGE